MISRGSFRSLLEIRWEDIPEQVKKCIKYRVLDFLGNALAGTESEVGKVSVAFAEKVFRGKQATILFPGAPRATILGAVYANATLASALDLDDGYSLAAGHPGAAVISSAFALGEYLKISGQRFLEAVLIGYEIATRTGQAVYAATRDRFFGSGAWASAGAAAVAAFLLSLPQERFVEALGITEAYTPLSPNLKSIANGSMVKESIGWGAVTGVAGALLAEEGFTGVVPILLEPDYLELLSDIGRNFRVLETYLKEYACCRWIHPAIEGVRDLTERFQIKRDEIVKIHISTFAKALALNNRYPTSSVAAQYSLPFAIAAFLCDGNFGPEQLCKNSLSRPEIVELAGKVEISVDPEFEACFPAKRVAKVTITTVSGESFTTIVVGSRGDPERPLSEKEVEGKFERLVTKVLKSWEAKKIQKMIKDLENINFKKFINFFRKCLK